MNDDTVIPFGSQRHKADSRSFPFRSYDQIQPGTNAMDFVEDLLVTGSAAVVYGESNSGKTFWTLDLALHVAAGRTWRGKEVNQGAVLYVACEGSQGFDNRIVAWRNEIGDDTRVAFAAVTSPIDLLRPDADTAALIETARAVTAHFDLPIKLIVIDTLSRAMAGGNENSPEDMGALVLHQDEIRAATGAALLWIHHSGKDAAKGARGHSLLRAAVDTEIEVTAEGHNHTVTVQKQRELESGETFQFTLRRIEIGTNARGKALTSCVVSHEGITIADRPAVRLPAQASRAYELLQDVLATSGKSGFRGTPPDCPSVPEDWWRDRFYGAAMPGADRKTREKAFLRAADRLLTTNLIGMAENRVWLR